MDVLDAQLRKIQLKEAMLAGAFSLAVCGGMAMALLSWGRDPQQAIEGLVPLFLGALLNAAGINPVRSPAMGGLAIAAIAAMLALVKAAFPA